LIMTPDAIIVLVILCGAVILFVTEKLPIDLVAMLVLGAVMVSGIVTPEEAISGFSNPATVAVAAMFVLSAGLQRTGVLRVVGRTLFHVGKYPLVLMVVITVVIGAVSAFINNTAAVAVFLPLVLAVAARLKMSPSKLLMPMSFASEFGGVCTLIGTSSNLLVSSISAEHALRHPEIEGLGPFSMFELGRLGLILCAAGVLYLAVVGYWILPARRGEQLTEAYKLGNYITELRVMAGSALIGKSALESQLGRKSDVWVLEILRDKVKLGAPFSERIREGDVLLVEGKLDNLMDLKDALKLEIAPEFKLKDEILKKEELTLMEVMVAPSARVAGRTLRALDFHSRYNAIVLAIQRQGRPLREKLNSVRLRFGDLLLLRAPEPAIAKLVPDEDFIVMDEKQELSVRKGKVPIAVGIFAAVVGLAALDAVPILVSAVLGCLAMLLTRCLSLRNAYDAIDWSVIFLLGGVLPLGLAIERSGLAQLIAEQTVALVGDVGPEAVLAAIFLLTSVLTACMSNNATAVLLAPIAISTAIQMGVSPKPLLLAVTFAASTCFATPMGYQTNMMVYNPGGYRFMDFMKVGLPLNIIFFVISVYYIPRIWPF